MHSYRELTAPELCTAFVRITGKVILKGRDAHMLSVLMRDRGVTPTQILSAMYACGEQSRSIPTMLNSIACDFILNEDILQSEAYLVAALTGKPMPPFAIAYFDLGDTGVQSAEIERYFKKAGEQLKEYLDDELGRTATILIGGRAAGVGDKRRKAYKTPSIGDTTE